MEKPINPLLRWVKEKRGRGQWIAEKIGVSGEHLSRLCNDHYNVTMEMAWLIEDATKRKVKAGDWIKYMREKHVYEAHIADTAER